MLLPPVWHSCDCPLSPIPTRTLWMEGGVLGVLPTPRASRTTRQRRCPCIFYFPVLCVAFFVLGTPPLPPGPVSPSTYTSGCFVIDSVCRQAQSKWGHKDVFTPRFAQRMAETVETLRNVRKRNKPPCWNLIFLVKACTYVYATDELCVRAAALGRTAFWQRRAYTVVECS